MNSFLDQIQVDEQAQVCPYCEQPLGGEPGIRYGYETLHIQCHEALGRDFDLRDAGQAEDEGALQAVSFE